MLARLLIFSFAIIATAACRPASDLGNQCKMVKRDPTVDGGRLFILNKEIRIGASKDFISFGSVECEDLVCVRDAQFPVPEGGFPPEGIANGYCSRGCQIGTACLSASAADDNDAKRRLTCRPLLLDAETLRLICNGSEADRAKCKAYLGNAESPDFCARGGMSDGGN